MKPIAFKSKIDVTLIQQAGGDHMVVAGAKVSTNGPDALSFANGTAKNDKGELWSDKDTAGLINYLVKHRHGCYDSQTEVLTNEGWKLWPNVTGNELFATLSPDNCIEYQASTNLVRKKIDGPMIKIAMQGVDLLVTPDHNMLAKRRTSSGQNGYKLVPAKDFLEASHRIKMGGGVWNGVSGKSISEAAMSLIGFFIGDGYCNGNRIEFHLRRKRKILYLLKKAKLAGFEITVSKDGEKFYLKADDAFIGIANECYDSKREKKIPESMLHYGTHLLKCLLDGLINSDGSIDVFGRIIYCTTSYRLAGQIQELALKTNSAAAIHEHPLGNNHDHYGSKDRYRVTLFNKRNAHPRIGWTTSDRKKEVQVVQYSGDIHCVTVPNGTLYVRRNGIPCWCGNTPFEHSFLTFFVHAPIFVWREWHRHRIGFSYNEESGRYKQLDPIFYLPDRDRPMMKVDGWKPGRPKFLHCESDDTFNCLCTNLRHAYSVSYEAYESNLALGIDPGLARDCLPVGIFSGCWVSCNPRSLMAFLSLRTHEPDSLFVSYPLWEIDAAARACEELFKAGWPITHKAFVDNKRVAP